MLDLCFRAAHVVDGAGNPWYRADVGVRDGRIVAVGSVDEPARRTLECDGLVLTPGFIDMHTHSDVQLLAHPDHACKVHQGVTLEVLGQDGLALAPVDDDTMALLRAQLAGWNGDRARARRQLAQRRRVSRPLRAHDRGQRLLPPPPRHAAAADRGSRRPPRDRGRARSHARARPPGHRRGRRRPLGGPHLRAGHVRERRRAGRALPRAHGRRLLLPAPSQLRQARDQGLRRLDRDRAARGRAPASRARAPRLRLQPRAGARAARPDRRGAGRRAST